MDEMQKSEQFLKIKEYNQQIAYKFEKELIE